MNGMNHACLLPIPSWSWSSFTDPGGIEGWDGLGTITVSKQSAQDCYVTAITVVSCSSGCASLGNWSKGERQTHDLSGRKPRWACVSNSVCVSVAVQLCRCSTKNSQLRHHRATCITWRSRNRWRRRIRRPPTRAAFPTPRPTWLTLYSYTNHQADLSTLTLQPRLASIQCPAHMLLYSRH